jgi:hypothetical protein
LLLTWRRSGGIAGLCDELRIYETGWAYAGVCQDGDFNSYGQVFLDGEQLEIVYNWQNRLAPLQVTRRDDFADGFQYDLTFIGRGEIQSTASQQQEMYTLADALFAAAIP